MTVRMRSLDKVVILDCSGDVDLHSSPRLRAALLAAIKTGGPSVLVNLSGVAFIDSTGIAALVEGLQVSRQTRTSLGLFGLRPNARSVLELAHLDKVFAIFENEAVALQKIESVPPFGGV